MARKAVQTETVPDEAAADKTPARFAHLHPKADAILERLPLESLRKICAGKDFPSKTAVLRWPQRDEEFCKAYKLAMELRAHAAADDAAYLREQIEGGEIKPDEARVLLDSIKWESGRRLPKHYGDRVQQEVTGAGGEPLFSGIQVSFVRPDPS